MGADESKLQAAQLRSQRDEDIPYTSYSINGPKVSPMTRTRVRNRSPQPPPRDSSLRHSGEGTSMGRPGVGGGHDIVVVAEGNTETIEDTELHKLEAVPVFLPLMRTSLNVAHLGAAAGNQTVEEILEKLDSEQLLLLCHRYQEHLRQCGEAVAFDQNALCVRIKEVDISIQTIYSHLTERQRKYAKYAEQIQKVSEMSTVLNKIRTNISEVVPLMDRLNSVLPPEHQLEPFVLKVK